MHTALRTVSRVLAVVVGGYAATVGLVALVSVLLVLGFGWQRSEAIILTTLVSFLGYTAIIIWGFSHTRLARLWFILGSVAVFSHLAADFLADRLTYAVGGG